MGWSSDNALVKLAILDQRQVEFGRRKASWRGLTVEHVELPTLGAFEYQWSGPRNYVAVHNIKLKEGETDLDGAAKVSTVDLVGRMTFMPPKKPY
jgi:hypothetical protein